MLAKSAPSSFHKKITYTTMFWSAWANIALEITCAMLTHSPQTTLHKKIIYNFVWIYLSQRCTRKLLVHCWPIWLTYSVYEENNLCKCCIDPSETTLHKKTTCTLLAQSAQTCFRRKTGCGFKWLVAFFLTRYNIFCSMLAREFIYGCRDNNERANIDWNVITSDSEKKSFLKELKTIHCFFCE